MLFLAAAGSADWTGAGCVVVLSCSSVPSCTVDSVGAVEVSSVESADSTISRGWSEPAIPTALLGSSTSAIGALSIAASSSVETGSRASNTSAKWWPLRSNPAALSCSASDVGLDASSDCAGSVSFSASASRGVRPVRSAGAVFVGGLLLAPPRESATARRLRFPDVRHLRSGVKVIVVEFRSSLKVS